MKLPEFFEPLAEKNNYHDLGKSKHAQLQQLTRVQVWELTDNVLEAKALSLFPSPSNHPLHVQPILW